TGVQTCALPIALGHFENRVVLGQCLPFFLPEYGSSPQRYFSFISATVQLSQFYMAIKQRRLEGFSRRRCYGLLAFFFTAVQTKTGKRYTMDGAVDGLFSFFVVDIKH